MLVIMVTAAFVEVMKVIILIIGPLVGQLIVLAFVYWRVTLPLLAIGCVVTLTARAFG
jgi:hypothetical protein